MDQRRRAIRAGAGAHAGQGGRGGGAGRRQRGGGGEPGEAFGAGVQPFQASNEKLVDTLQRIEASLERSTARSDEQLAYYVAQAREVIDLSITSQQGLVENLQQLQAQAAQAAGAGRGGRGMMELDDGDVGAEPSAPVWAVFGDLMSGLLGAFVLVLVGVLVVQMDLVATPAGRGARSARSRSSAAWRWKRRWPFRWPPAA